MAACRPTNTRRAFFDSINRSTVGRVFAEKKVIHLGL